MAEFDNQIEGNLRITGKLEVIQDVQAPNVQKIESDVKIISSQTTQVIGALGTLIDQAASDAYLTTTEKRSILTKWEEVKTEYPIIRQGAIDDGISSEDALIVNFDGAYTALRTYLLVDPGVLSDMTIGEEIEAVAFVAAWENYYNYRTQLVSARIALKANAADVNIGSYLGMFAAAPSDKVTGDWYLNSGDGLIRIWNGTAWTTSGVTWLHKIAAIEDLYSIAASASQVFTSMIVASEAFIEELASKTIKSAELCEDGTTSRVEFQLNDAILLFRNASQTLLQQISEAAFTSYEGAGAYRKAVRISGNKLTWVNAPEGGSEVEVSRMLRDPAENRVRLEGLFGKYNAEKIFEQQTLSASNYNTNDVAWSPSLGIFVACGGTGTLCFTSPDGITWTQRTVSATARTWSKIAWSSSLGLFVMVAAGTVCATSPDGTTWTERTISATSRTWQAITWSEDLGLFVIGAYGVAVCATSPDGTTWTERSLPVTAYPSEIAWSSSLGLFVMNSSTMGTFCLTSPDGTTWTQRTISGTSRLWRGLEWSPELGLFILTAAGYVATSPDGTTWTERTVSAISGTPGVVKWSSAFGFFLLIPYGTGSTAYTSEDGINWTARPMGLTAPWVGLTWSPDRGIFVMVANTTTKCLTLRELGYSELVTINDITTSCYFKARKNSSQSVTANVTNITFPLVDEDPYGTFDGTTFTAPADGLYLFLYQRFAPSAGSSASLYRNGTVTPTPICTTSGYDSGASLLYLNAGDTVTVRCSVTTTIGTPAGLEVVLLRGTSGSKGDKGDTGDAATIEVGTVAPGDNPEDASVVNSGDSGAAVFDFVLPKGDPGTTVPNISGLSELTGANVDRAADPLIIYDASSGSHKRITPRALGCEIPGFIFGLKLSNNATDANNDINIAAGRATASGSILTPLILPSSITKRLDAAWAAGTNAGGLDTGTKAVSSTYHVFIISNGTAVDILFSLSATSPTMPSGYTLKRRIGSIMTDGSGNIIAFHQNGDRFDLDTIVQVYNAGISTAVATVTAKAPTGIKTIARVALGGYANTSGGHYIQIYPKYQTPLAVGAAQVGSGASSGADNAGGYAEVETDTAAQFYAKRVLGSGTWTLVIVSLGWIDRRGQDGEA